MLTVHHLRISQSERVVWTCEELGLPYELKLYTRHPETRLAPPEYKAMHPFETAPVITDGDIVLAESGAIVDYIVGKYGNGRLTVTPESADYAPHLFWVHFANASLMPILGRELLIAMAPQLAENAMVANMRKRWEMGLGMAEQRLGETPWFGGQELTAADIMMLFPLTTMRHWAPKDLSAYPNILAYLQRVGARPAYQRAMDKAEPGWAPLLT